jgi:hypothetical protein
MEPDSWAHSRPGAAARFPTMHHEHDGVLTEGWFFPSEWPSQIEASAVDALTEAMARVTITLDSVEIAAADIMRGDLAFLLIRMPSCMGLAN